VPVLVPVLALALVPVPELALVSLTTVKPLVNSLVKIFRNRLAARPYRAAIQIDLSFEPPKSHCFVFMARRTMQREWPDSRPALSLILVNFNRRWHGQTRINPINLPATAARFPAEACGERQLLTAINESQGERLSLCG
jgi:hypothetical protein